MSGKSQFKESKIPFLKKKPFSPKLKHTNFNHRVINVIRWWVENYWQDFNNHVALLGSLLEFGEMIKSAGFDSEAEQLEASMLAQVCFSSSCLFLVNGSCRTPTLPPS